MTKRCDVAEVMPISDLYPTQLTLGMREVERRADEIKALSPRQRDDYVADRVVPCVKGLKGKLFIVDRHHMCRSLLSIGAKEVHTHLLCEAADLPADEFWTFMDLRGWVHPFDAQGRRCPITSLPRKIVDLVDDPYRALAGFLRRDQGFKKEDTPFEEFIWADFLRRRVDSKLLASEYEKAKATALKLARSDLASHLPGWKKAK
jgi:hypothetical protein